MTSKKKGTTRQLAESAGSPIDFVSAAGLVRGCLKLNKWLKTDIIDFLMHYEFVRAADRVPRSLCHAITNLSRLTGETGSQLIKPSVLWLVILEIVSCKQICLVI
jgi:hypothetical protein